MDWISIKDQLPIAYERVLVSGEEGVFTAYRDDFESSPSWQSDPAGGFIGDGCVFGVTHWAPLPLPPPKKEVK